MENKLNPYSEVCNTIRHYSTLSYNVRVLSVVQGFVLFTIWIYAFDKKTSAIIFIPIIGILFTTLIFRFHKAYYTTVGFFIEQAIKIEKKIFSEEFSPFDEFQKYHTEKYKTWYAKATMVNASFSLILVLFIVLFVISIFKIQDCL